MHDYSRSFNADKINSAPQTSHILPPPSGGFDKSEHVRAGASKRGTVTQDSVEDGDDFDRVEIEEIREFLGS